MLEEAPFLLDILPSAMMDIVRTQYFYDSLERGLGSVFRDYIVGEVDKLVDNAGVDECGVWVYNSLRKVEFSST